MNEIKIHLSTQNEIEKDLEFLNMMTDITYSRKVIPYLQKLEQQSNDFLNRTDKDILMIFINNILDGLSKNFKSRLLKSFSSDGLVDYILFILSQKILMDFGERNVKKL